MTTKNLNQLGNQKFLADTFDFTVRDYATKEVLFRVNYAQNVSLSIEYDKTEVRGGAKNQKHIVVDHTPESLFNADLPLNDDNVIAVKTGASVKRGAQVSNYDRVYTVDKSAGTLELPFTPEVGTLKIHDTNDVDDMLEEIVVGEPSKEEQAYSISGKTITFNGVKKGQMVFVSFDYETGANAESLTVVAGQLPGFISIDLKSLVTDKNGKKAVQVVRVPKAKPSPNLNFETSAGDPSVMPFECDILTNTNEDGKQEFFRIITDTDVEIF